MAMGSIAALIYYIHHVAASLQVSRITSTLTSDLETAIDRLYPAALNEPFTAITCIDGLGQGLSPMATRRIRIPSAARTDHADRIRVVAEPPSFSRLLRAAFDPIAVYAERTPEIYQRALETLARVAQRTGQAGDLLDAAHRHVVDERHRALIEALYARVVTAASSRRQAWSGESPWID